jgi:hypothetical protein
MTVAATDPVGHHRRGGFLLLMQSRYQHHLHVHRARHFEAVAHALTGLVDHYGVRDIVLAGEARNLAVFRTHIPPRLAKCVAGEVTGTRWEPASALAERGVALLAHRASGALGVAVDAVLAEAGAGGRYAAGIDMTLEAVNRGTVDRLFLLDSWEEDGQMCASCRGLQRARNQRCRWCGGPTVERELGEAMVQRVLASGADVAPVDVHAGLARAGGAAAVLRYPLA